MGGFTLGFGDSASAQEVALAGVRVMLWVSAGVVRVLKSTEVIEMLMSSSAPQAEISALAGSHLTHPREGADAFCSEQELF